MKGLTAALLAKMRNDLHRRSGNQSLRFYKNRYVEDVIGAHGEICFGRAFGFPVNTEKRLKGDNGVDFMTPIGGIDVKTFRKPYNLLVKTSEICGAAKFYVLGKYTSLHERVIFLGWATKDRMLRCPTKEFAGYGILNHYLASRYLHSMRELRDMLAEAKKKGTQIPLLPV